MQIIFVVKKKEQGERFRQSHKDCEDARVYGVAGNMRPLAEGAGREASGGCVRIIALARDLCSTNSFARMV